jgi:NO-binding membrane sensor protein with MHYT domain
VELALYAVSLATTVLSTMIIVIRILLVSRIPGTSRQPQIAMEIIVESAVLYSISTLVYTSMLSSIMTSKSLTSATHNQYAELFFTYMAVASHSSCPPVLVI